jgi:pyruvate dehydrogenase (quinone)
VPVVAIAAHIPSAEIGSGYFQETHPKSCSANARPIASWSPCRADAARAGNRHPPRGGRTLRQRDRHPRRCRLQEIPAVKPANPLRCCPRAPPCRPEAVEALADLLNGATRVTLLCGGGTAGAHDEVVGWPVCSRRRWSTPCAARSISNMTTPTGGHDRADRLFLGLLRHGGLRCAADAGHRFPYRQFYPQGAKIAQVDMRAEMLGRRADLELACWAKWPTLEALLPLIADKAGTRICKPALPITARRARGWTSWPPASPAGGSTRSIWCAC